MRGNQTSSCREYPCLLYRKGGTEAASAMISDEIAWELWLNDRCVSHMTSSPHELDVLAVGYCRQQGLIKDGQAVRAFYENRGVSVAVVGIKPTLASKRRPMTVTAERLCSYGTLLDELSAAHHMTHVAGRLGIQRPRAAAGGGKGQRPRRIVHRLAGHGDERRHRSGGTAGPYAGLCLAE